SEEHTSELQSLTNLVCRLLLEKKKTHARRVFRSVTHRLCWLRHTIPNTQSRRECSGTYYAGSDNTSRPLCAEHDIVTLSTHVDDRLCCSCYWHPQRVDEVPFASRSSMARPLL